MSLDSNLILQQAIENTGLNDFGDKIFIEGLHKLVSSINNEASLNEVGFQAQEHRILGLLINLLRTVDALKNNPEILEQDIISPIVIIGLPRTGSTMTHRLLASDPNHTAMLWWEGRYPAVLPNEVRGNPQERMQLGEAEVAAVVEASPEALKIHPWDFNGADEEILLIEHTFLSTVPESCMHLPSYSTWIEEQDHKVVYEFLKKQIQYLTWQNPGREEKRWVLKSPHHLGFIDKVLDVFPDAKVKFFLSADLDIRTTRRNKQIEENNILFDTKKVVGNLIKRDKTDSERKIAPLKKPKDAFEIDTSKKSELEVFNIAKNYIETNLGA